jgi:hypothetical protein
MNQLWNEEGLQNQIMVLPELGIASRLIRQFLDEEEILFWLKNVILNPYMAIPC